MGKHNTKSGPAQTRSRGRRDGGRRSHSMVPSKNMRRPSKRLEQRQKYYNEVLSKSPRSSRYKMPGSLKARTN